MLAAAAVCPHPPLIVPELAGAAAPELDELRSACRAAITGLRAADPDLLVVVGGADSTSRYDGGAAGTLRPWGADVTVGHGDPVLPLSLTIGRWLLEDHAADHYKGHDADHDKGHDVAAFQAVAFDAAPGDCLALGEDLVREGRVALLVMADGSARLTEKAPGYHDPAAQPYNEAIARAIADADVSALAHLDPAKADRLWVAGRAAFQVLAGAAGQADVEGRLLADLAPYGVGYFVGLWR